MKAATAVSQPYQALAGELNIETFDIDLILVHLPGIDDHYTPESQPWLRLKLRPHRQ